MWFYIFWIVAILILAGVVWYSVRFLTDAIRSRPVTVVRTDDDDTDGRDRRTREERYLGGVRAGMNIPDMPEPRGQTRMSRRGYTYDERGGRHSYEMDNGTPIYIPSDPPIVVNNRLYMPPEQQLAALAPPTGTTSPAAPPAGAAPTRPAPRPARGGRTI